jgi:hypothetical protein
MLDSPVWVLAAPLLAYIVYFALLLAARSMFGAFDLSRVHIAVAALYLTALVGGAAYLAFLWIVPQIESGGSELTLAICELPVVVVASFSGFWLLLWLANYSSRQSYCTSSQCWKMSLTTAVLFPVLFAALAIGGAKLYGECSRYREDVQYTAFFVVQGAEAEALRAKYGLPAVDCVDYTTFCRNRQGEESYSKVVQANASAPVWSPEKGTWTQWTPVPGTDPWSKLDPPWREWTEHIASQAQSGLTAAGYTVERTKGMVRRYKFYRSKPGHNWSPNDKPEVSELPDIVVLGTRGESFVRFVVTYAPTQGIPMPEVELDFGALKHMPAKGQCRPELDTVAE